MSQKINPLIYQIINIVAVLFAVIFNSIVNIMIISIAGGVLLQRRREQEGQEEGK